MISYNLAPIPIWPLVDNQGEPLSNGYMLAFRDLVRSEFKPVYQNAAGTTAWLQPIVFNAAGFQGPFYWASDENYYLEIYDSTGALIKTISAYNAPDAGGSGPITVNANIINYIQDAQFRFIRKMVFTPAPQLVQVGSSNWLFQKNNGSATDSITYIPFIEGSMVPPNNPPYSLQYECTVAGAGETFKDLFYRFQSVYSFQNTEITVAFWAISQTAGTELQFLMYQFFGSGGTPSASVVQFPAVATLTTGWAQYQATFVVPSIAGKTLGTNQDDFIGIGVQYPLDSICQIKITNFQLNLVATLEQFEYLPATNTTPIQIPFFRSTIDRNALLSLDRDGIMKWNSANQVGYYFTANSSLTSVGLGYSVLPLVPILNPDTWIASNRFTPTTPCFAWMTASYNVASSSGNVEVQITARLNGGVELSSASFSLGAPNSSGEITLPVQYPFNGTTDYLEFVGRFTAAGVAGVTLSLLSIKTL